MYKQFAIALTLLISVQVSFSQTKTLIGIVPFKNGTQNNNYYQRGNSNANANELAIQDAVGDAFLKTKRFSLVEREKMDQLKTEKNLQKSEDFIDGSVIEQSKSLGAQYVVLGNIQKASFEQKQSSVPIAGMITNYTGEVAFSIRIVDVATSEIVASKSFSATGKGKNAFADALNTLKPEIEQFIKDNFKINGSVASVEEKGHDGEATKILISCGSSMGVLPGNSFKVYEVSEMEVDGKKLTRKKTLGTVTVLSVEDENFSICAVKEGGADMAKKVEAHAKIKCELINP